MGLDVGRDSGVPSSERVAHRRGSSLTLAEVASFAVFAASDRAGALTGAIANLTCGSLVD